MRGIAIITDFGDSHYSGILKGVISRVDSGIVVTDITHHISPQNVVEAAMVLKESLPYFGEETVFMVVVDPGVGSKRRGVVIRSEDQFFVGPDNGVFEPVYQRGDYQPFEIVKKDFFVGNVSSTFHARDIFAPLSAYIASGRDISNIVSPLEHPVRLRIDEPVVDGCVIKGKILYIDSFGNLITNIPAEYVGKYICSVKIKNRRVGRVRNTYSDVPPGLPVAVVGSSNMIEIAVCSGSAERYFNIRRDRLDRVSITVNLRLR